MEVLNMQKKKILSLTLAASMLLAAGSLTACKRSNDPVYSRRTNVYGATELTLPEGIQWINRMVAVDDTVYLVYDKQIEVIRNSDGTITENDAGLEPGYDVAPAVVETEVPVEDGMVMEDEMVVEPMVEYINQTWIYSTTLDGSVTDKRHLVMPEATEQGYMSNMTSADGLLYMLYETWARPPASGCMLWIPPVRKW